MFHLAYIDPGSGSIILQMIIGGFLGAVYVGRKAIYAIIARTRALLGRAPKDKPADKIPGDEQ